MNLRYGLAVMALDRAAGVDQFRADKLRDPAIMDFIRRVGCAGGTAPSTIPAGALRVACRLDVQCRDGAQHQAEVLYRKGSPEDPMTDDELGAKFMQLAGKAVSAQAAQRIAALVDGLDGVECLKNCRHC